MNDISAKIVSALKDVLKETYVLDAEAGILNIEIPKDPKMGDYSSTCAMRLAKTLHQNPKMIAETVAEGLKGKLPEAETIEIAGPGFINLPKTPTAAITPAKENGSWWNGSVPIRPVTCIAAMPETRHGATVSAVFWKPAAMMY